MSDLQVARVEAAAKALRDDKANRTDLYVVPEWSDTSHGDKLIFRGQARAALAAADAVVTVEMVRSKVRKAVFNSENHPVPHAVLGRDVSKLIDAVVAEVYPLLRGGGER